MFVFMCFAAEAWKPISNQLNLILSPSVCLQKYPAMSFFFICWQIKIQIKISWTWSYLHWLACMHNFCTTCMGGMSVCRPQMQANMKPRFRSEKNCLNCHLTQFACRDLGATCIGKGCQSATPKCRQIWTPRFKVKKLHQNLGANCMEGCQSAPNAGKCRFKTEKIASKSHTVILAPLAWKDVSLP